MTTPASASRLAPFSRLTALTSSARPSDGASGLAAARSLRPDLVLLDIGLPDVEGFEVARALAVDGPPPFVVLTSSREASDYGPRLASSRVLGLHPQGRAVRRRHPGAGSDRR